MNARTIVAFLLAFLAPAGAARADFVLVGNNPDTELAAPFGLDSDGPGDPSDRYQQVYRAGLFGASPYMIHSLTFYATPSLGGGGDFNPVTYQIYFSTTTAAISGLATNLDANVGANEALFATITPTGPAPGQFTITGSAFDYDPTRGNLLLDIRIAGQTSTGAFLGASFDALGDFGGDSASVNNFSSPVAASSGGLVTGFNAVPEPASLVLLGLGCAGAACRSRRRARAVPARHAVR